ncbi:MAG: ABC-type nitrate/sulfonate/bicarbonate transport system [Microvirga sp.]|jgi:NitT/TauT family transport system substrate-binding protein|nr:ABC-type nitrate/sulfonate/bicarbonate transport system [Microvirga sp.]
MPIIQHRRHFLASALAAAATILGSRDSLADEGPPETTTIRLGRYPNICGAPVDLAEDLLLGEGFTDIRYVAELSVDAVARGEIYFDLETAAWVAFQLDAGEPITALAGVHPGCYELFAHAPIQAISDLKGKRVGIAQQLGQSGHLLLAVIAAQVGLDPHEDIDWIASPTVSPMELFAEGQVDAFLAFPPEPQELRARRIGRMILNLGTDKPWSQYLCCIAFGNREFVRDHPVATKRFLRAILKAADICAAEPERAAQQLVDRGFAERYDYALQMLAEIPYDSWRDFDPADAIRFYALRLHEVGMVKSSPAQILAEGTDWRFLDELKRELKA